MKKAVIALYIIVTGQTLVFILAVIIGCLSLRPFLQGVLKTFAAEFVEVLDKRYVPLRPSN